MIDEETFKEVQKVSNVMSGISYTNKQHQFEKENLILLEELIEGIENSGYIDANWGYMDDFIIESIDYYLNKLERLNK